MLLKNKQCGVALLEVMISVFILAIGLLGLAQLQATALKHNESAYLRSQASTLASDVLDSMRSNITATQAGNYNFSVSDTPPATPNTIAERDIVAWLYNISTFMPAGSNGLVACTDSNNGDGLACSAGSLQTVTIRWVEAKNDGSRGQTEFIYSGIL
jgi:type IV pilus assembly protein PilV